MTATLEAASERTVWENGMLRRGERYQVPGVVCPDCAAAQEFGWCTSDRHPLFGPRGELVQMTPMAPADRQREARHSGPPRGLLRRNRRK